LRAQFATMAGKFRKRTSRSLARLQEHNVAIVGTLTSAGGRANAQRPWHTSAHRVADARSRSYHRRHDKAIPAALARGCSGIALGYTPAARALDLGGLAGKAADAAGGKARDKAVKDVNAKLLAEGRKNQCSFKTDSDELVPGCDAKLKKLADVLVKVKQNLKVSGVTNYKFEVSGHTDTSGSAAHNKQLSANAPP